MSSVFCIFKKNLSCSLGVFDAEKKLRVSKLQLVKRIMFNDAHIHGVHHLTGHDDHLHIEVKI